MEALRDIFVLSEAPVHIVHSTAHKSTNPQIHQGTLDLPVLWCWQLYVSSFAASVSSNMRPYNEATRDGVGDANWFWIFRSIFVGLNLDVDLAL
jgi:hypothetical protein